MNRKWLKELRELKKLTQLDVSKSAGIKRPSYSLIENGSRRPSPEVAMKLGKLLGFDWTRFFDEEVKGA